MDPEPRPARSPPADPPQARRAGAFVVDPETQGILEHGLPDWEVEVRAGNIRSAIEVLASNPSPKLILVDLDGAPYPAGSIHELASVCEIGTIVIALGSTDSARFSRGILTTGVADYLIKPITRAGLREAVVGAVSSGRDPQWCGRSVGFAGTGGSGATTLLAATAVAAAARGRHVSVLDLNRAFSALPFLLDVEPVPGLDELLEAAASGPPDETLVDAARVPHSDRISVYGYRWNPVLPPPASLKGVRQLLATLCRRAHLVLVDPEPLRRVAVVRDCDLRVLVTEPTRSGALRSVRAHASFEPGQHTVHVRNRTRPLRRSDIAKALRTADSVSKFDLEFPYHSDLPELSDWGHLPGQLPRQLLKPLDRLMDLLTKAPITEHVDMAVMSAAA